jgi:hypothetical protein
MRVLGLDPSLTNFGWALHDTDAVGRLRCPERGRFHTSSKTLYIDRYCDMRASLLELIARLGVQRVGIEFPIFNDIWSEGMYGLFLYASEALRMAKVDVVFLANNQTKAHCRRVLDRPKGWKIGKPDMIEGAKFDTGGKGRWSGDEADAYWVARVAGRFWQLFDEEVTVDDLTPLERKQFTAIHTYSRGKKAGQTVLRGIQFREGERFFRWSQLEGDG